MKAPPRAMFGLILACLFVLAISASGQAISPLGSAQTMDLKLRGDSVFTLTVSDWNGARIPASTVSIEQDGTGLKVEGKTDEAGVYRVAGLASGIYSITVQRLGFRQETFPFELRARGNQSTTVTLQVGAASYIVPPGGEAPLLETITSSADPDFVTERDTNTGTAHPTQTKKNSVKHFFSTLGHKLGF